MVWFGSYTIDNISVVTYAHKSCQKMEKTLCQVYNYTQMGRGIFSSYFLCSLYGVWVCLSFGIINHFYDQYALGYCKLRYHKKPKRMDIPNVDDRTCYTLRNHHIHYVFSYRRGVLL